MKSEFYKRLKESILDRLLQTAVMKQRLEYILNSWSRRKIYGPIIFRHYGEVCVMIGACLNDLKNLDGFKHVHETSVDTMDEVHWVCKSCDAKMDSPNNVDSEVSLPTCVKCGSAYLIECPGKVPDHQKAKPSIRYRDEGDK
jgi:hypothetical protein